MTEERRLIIYNAVYNDRCWKDHSVHSIHSRHQLYYSIIKAEESREKHLGPGMKYLNEECKLFI